MKILISTSAKETSSRQALIDRKAKLEVELAEITKQLRAMSVKDSEMAEASVVRIAKAAGLKLTKVDSGNYEVKVEGLKKSIKNSYGGIWLGVNNSGKVTITLLRTITKTRGRASTAQTYTDTVEHKVLKPAATEAALVKAVNSMTKAAARLVEMPRRNASVLDNKVRPSGRRT